MSKLALLGGTPAIQNSSNTERKTVFDGEIHKCPNCGELKRPHNVCTKCGQYDGKEVVAQKADK